MRRTISLVFHLLICLFVYLYIGILTPPAYAQGQQPTNLGPAEVNVGKSWALGGTFSTGLYDALRRAGSNSEAYTNSVVSNTGNAFILQLGGCVNGFTVDESILKTDPDYCKKLNGASAITGVNNLIYAMVVNPPASTNLAILDFGRSLGFVSPQAFAQGQGIGFTGLAPLLPIWKGFRNISYSILAIIMIVIGFMVMFRKKIDPKTVVTVQNALPGIVVTMLLITFSYAIAGFMIDLMYLVTAVGIAILAPAGYAIGLGATGSLFSQPTGAVQNFYLNPNDLLSGGFFALLTGVFGPLLNLINPFSGALGFGVVGNVLQQFQAGNIIPGIIGAAITGPQVAASFGLGLLLTLVMLLAFLIAFIRIFFMLLTSYVNVILSVIIAPLQFLLGAVPGGDGFGSWAKNMITNLIAFPITILILIIANWLGSSATTSQLNTLWVPPLLPQPVVGNNAVSNFAYTIIWLGLIMSIPTIVGNIKEALKAKPAIPGGMGVLAGMGGQSIGVLMQAYQLYTSHKTMEAFRKGLPGAKTGAGDRGE